MYNDINEMHKKFGVHKWIQEKVKEQDWNTLRAFLNFRIQFLREELSETQIGIEQNKPEEVVDGLIDILVVAIGTLDAFDVDIDRAWKEVHSANMAKEVGVKETRPNPLGLPDLIKPEGWKDPDHKGNVGHLGSVVFPKDRHRCNCYSCYMGRGYNV